MPKVYVRLLVFDADSNLVSSQPRQLSSAARTGYEPLSVQVIAPQDGYVTAYVGNESNADVYFDDVSVEHRQGLQIQENQYDPFGLTLVGIDHMGALPENKRQFNGKEQERELGLNWQDFNWRHYDPATARFFGVDRLAEKFVYMTDYQFASNNPTSKIEFDGLEGIPFMELFVEHVVMPAVNYLSAYRNEVVNQVEHNTQNGYTDHVPADVRAVNQQVRTLNNTSQAISALGEMGSTALGLIGTLEGGAIAAVGSTRLLSASSVKNLDLFGGPTSRYSGALNVDMQAEKGFKGTLDQFVDLARRDGVLGKTASITADNPQASFVEQASQLLKPGGQMTVRGTRTNAFVKNVLNGEAKGMENFTVSQEARQVSSQGFSRTDGTPIKSPTMWEIVLTRN